MKILSHIGSTFVVVVFLCISCGGEYLEDPLDPRYIMYTESGKGAAGASINGEQWKSVVMPGLFFGGSDYPTLYSYPENDSIILIFEGSMTNSQNYTRIEFRLNGINISNDDDVFDLGGTRFILDGVNHFGLVSPFKQWPEYPPGNGPEYTGQIYFRSITTRNFSGTFYIYDDIMEVAYGRFDYNLDNLGITIF